jgi:hypothetical protein
VGKKGGWWKGSGCQGMRVDFSPVLPRLRERFRRSPVTTALWVAVYLWVAWVIVSGVWGLVFDHTPPVIIRNP